MKTTAILIPTYKRFDDLVNTLSKTYIDERAKFIIVAHLEDEEFDYIKKNFGDKSIIVDERKYRKLGGAKAYNLAFKISKDNGFDFAILFADDVIPFDKNWLNKLYRHFIYKNSKFGIFSSDECHDRNYGWNFLLDCPIAHFFIIDCTLVEQLFLDDYKQYVIDFELAVRLKERGIDIRLLPIKLNHLRSGLHRDMFENNFNSDVDVFLKVYPKYESTFRQSLNEHFLKSSYKTLSASNVCIHKLPLWSEVKPKEKFIRKLKRKVKSVINYIAKFRKSVTTSSNA